MEFQDFDVEIFNLDGSNWLEVDFDKRYSGFRIQCRTAVDVLLKRTSGDTDPYFTIKSGTILELFANADENTHLYLKAGSAVVVEIIKFQ